MTFSSRYFYIIVIFRLIMCTQLKDASETYSTTLIQIINPMIDYLGAARQIFSDQRWNNLEQWLEAYQQNEFPKKNTRFMIEQTEEETIEDLIQPLSLQKFEPKSIEFLVNELTNNEVMAIFTNERIYRSISKKLEQFPRQFSVLFWRMHYILGRVVILVQNNLVDAGLIHRSCLLQPLQIDELAHRLISQRPIEVSSLQTEFLDCMYEIVRKGNCELNVSIKLNNMWMKRYKRPLGFIVDLQSSINVDNVNKFVNRNIATKTMNESIVRVVKTDNDQKQVNLSKNNRYEQSRKNTNYPNTQPYKNSFGSDNQWNKYQQNERVQYNLYPERQANSNPYQTTQSNKFYEPPISRKPIDFSNESNENRTNRRIPSPAGQNFGTNYATSQFKQPIKNVMPESIPNRDYIQKSDYIDQVQPQKNSLKKISAFPDQNSFMRQNTSNYDFSQKNLSNSMKLQQFNTSNTKVPINMNISSSAQKVSMNKFPQFKPNKLPIPTLQQSRQMEIKTPLLNVSTQGSKQFENVKQIEKMSSSFSGNFAMSSAFGAPKDNSNDKSKPESPKEQLTDPNSQQYKLALRERWKEDEQAVLISSYIQKGQIAYCEKSLRQKFPFVPKFSPEGIRYRINLIIMKVFEKFETITTTKNQNVARFKENRSYITKLSPLPVRRKIYQLILHLYRCMLKITPENRAEINQKIIEINRICAQENMGRLENQKQ